MSQSPPFDLVIFDLDGTLVDSLPDIAAALNATLAQAGRPSLPVEAIATFVGDGAAKLIARAFPSSAADATEHATLLGLFMTAYAGAVCVESRLYPGVTDLLTALDTQGVATAVLTNKPGPLARALMEQLSIARHFRAVVGDGDGFPRKPNPTAALALIKQVRASSSSAVAAGVPRTVIVGDGLPDLRMARAIPCASIAAGWGYVPLDRLKAEAPTYVAASVAEATGILLPPSMSVSVSPTEATKIR